MALKGSLQEFAPPDVIQLVGRQNHQGTVVLKQRMESVGLVFRAGVVVRVEDNAHPFEPWLLKALSAAKVLSPADVAAVQRVAKAGGLGVAGRLLKAGLVGQDQLVALAKVWSGENAFRVFGFKEGLYEFTAHDVADSPDGLDWNVRWDNLVMEGLKRADEWPDIYAVIPHSQVRLDVERALPPLNPAAALADDAAFLDGFEDDSIMGDASGSTSQTRTFEVILGPSERALHALVHPGITAQEVVDASLLGTFEAMRALATLVRTGFLRMEGITVEVELGF